MKGRWRRRHVPVHGPWPTHVHPVVQRVLAARGVHSPEQAELRLAALLHPQALSGLESALDLLQRALHEQWSIVVVGDFDADGATGTATAVRGLRMLGARRVDYCVPHRLRHGYGLSPALVADLAERRPDLLLTVDNGIASHAGVDAARAAGMRVLVTDHHLPGEVLPGADAIVNPNLPGDPFPSKHLAGVGVVFYLLLALRARLRAAGAFAAGEPDLTRLLDLVALGTVADLVPLDRNNRILVAAGLKRLRAGQCQPGVRALVEVAGRRLEQLTSSDLGFAVAPRLNAAGRLEDMALGIECLLADDPRGARAFAEQLHALNAERQGLQAEMVAQAEAMVASWNAQRQGPLPVGVCLFEPDWHAGIIGLVAARLKERLHRPVIAFAADGEGGLRGSARSIPGFHIRDALAIIDARHPGLVPRFGGHAMAAGLSLPQAHLPMFAAAFDAVARERLDEAALAAEWLSDGELGPDEFVRELAEQLRQAGPFGQAFPEPAFDGEFEVLDWRCVGTSHLKLRLLPPAARQPIEAIHFGGFDGAPPPAQVRLLYQLELDDFRDRRGVQLLVRYREPA